MNRKLSIRAFLCSFAAAFFALTVLGMAAVLLVRPMPVPSQAVEPEEVYLPQKADTLDVLILGVDDSKTPNPPPAMYMLIRLDPSTGRIPVLTMPGNLSVDLEQSESISETFAVGDGNGDGTTLTNIYSSQGITGLENALSGSYGIAFDRYAKVPVSHFERIVNLVGPTRFHIDREMILKHGDITTHLSEGNQLIDGKKALNLAQYDGFSDQIEQCQTLTKLCCDAVNQHLDLVKSDMAERIFTGVINLMDTDISSFDYAEKKQAISFMAELQREPAISVLPQFLYNAQSDIYSITDDSIDVIKKYFG